MKRIFVAFVIALTAAAIPARAQNPHCEHVGGVLMTNINEIAFGPYAPMPPPTSALRSEIWPGQ